MGKKKERCSKRKRRACLLEKCANMTKKRKQSLEQCSENKTMESSSDCNKSQEMVPSFLKGNQDNTLPNYGELQNVLPATADTDDKNISHNEGISVAITDKHCDKISASSYITEALVIGRQCSSDDVSSEMIVERTSEASIEPEVQDIEHRIIDVSHFVTELVKFSEHKSLFNCGLATLKLEF